MNKCWKLGLVACCIFCATRALPEDVDQTLAGITIGESTLESAQAIFGKGLQKRFGDARSSEYDWNSASCSVRLFLTSGKVSGILLYRYVRAYRPPQASSFCRSLKTGRGIGLWSSPQTISAIYGKPTRTRYEEDRVRLTFQTGPFCRIGQIKAAKVRTLTVAAAFGKPRPPGLPPGALPPGSLLPGKLESIALHTESGTCTDGEYIPPGS
jgi:hypothetical protein